MVPGEELPAHKVILSFDDSPNINGDTTARVLDMLRANNIHAMFSVLGVNAENAPELVRRMYDEGHLIINHGYSDKWACYMNADEFRKNLLQGQAAINAALGFEYNPLLYRPHGGFYLPSQEKIWREEGYTMVPGAIRAYDATLKDGDQEKVIRRIIEKTKKAGSGIILLHDSRDSHTRMEENLKEQPDGPYNRSWIPGTAERIITELTKSGYQFILPVY